MSLPTLKVEIAFATDPDASAPNYQDVSTYAKAGSIQRGRQYELDEIQPNTLTLTLNNGDRRFDPTYSYSPYYPYVLPMRKIRVSATWSGTTYYLFTGYINGWPLDWDQPAWGTVTVSAVDGMGALGQANIDGTFAQALTGTRISQVLTAAAWPSSTPAAGYWVLGTSQLGIDNVLSYGIPETVIDAGQTTVAQAVIADADNVTALAHIQEIAAAERGVFFIDGQGRAVFQDRHHRVGAASQVTFTDNQAALDATHLPYKGLAPDFDVTRILNDVTVTRTGGTAQNATDGASRQRYLRRSLALAPPLLTDAEALDQANYELVLHHEPKLRFDNVTFNAQAHDNSWPHALGRELGDRVTVIRTPGTTPTGTSETMTRDCFIEAVAHSWSPGRWDTAFQLSPAEVYDQFWVLGTSALDQTTVLSY